MYHVNMIFKTIFEYVWVNVYFVFLCFCLQYYPFFFFFFLSFSLLTQFLFFEVTLGAEANVLQIIRRCKELDVNILGFVKTISRWPFFFFSKRNPLHKVITNFIVMAILKCYRGLWKDYLPSPTHFLLFFLPLLPVPTTNCCLLHCTCPLCWSLC